MKIEDLRKVCYNVWCPWHAFIHNQEKDGEGQENRDSKWNFLIWFWRQQKYQQTHDGQKNDWNHNIYNGVLCFPLQEHVQHQTWNTFKKTSCP